MEEEWEKGGRGEEKKICCLRATSLPTNYLIAEQKNYEPGDAALRNLRHSCNRNDNEVFSPSQSCRMNAASSRDLPPSKKEPPPAVIPIDTSSTVLRQNIQITLGVILPVVAAEGPFPLKVVGNPSTLGAAV